MCGMGCYVLNILLSHENSFPIVLSGEVQCPRRWLRQALYLTRQHYRRTVPSCVDNNRTLRTRWTSYNVDIVVSPGDPQNENLDHYACCLFWYVLVCSGLFWYVYLQKIAFNCTNHTKQNWYWHMAGTVIPQKGSSRLVIGFNIRNNLHYNPNNIEYYRDRCGRDRMVVGFTTTYIISAYHN